MAKGFRIGKTWAEISQVSPVINNPPANAGDIRDMRLISGSGRSHGRKHGNPLQYSCLENPMDRGAWQGPWDRKESDTLRRLSMYACVGWNLGFLCHLHAMGRFGEACL